MTLLLWSVSLFGAMCSTFAATVGDQVELRATHRAGVSFHSTPGGRQTVHRVADGSVGTETAVRKQAATLGLTRPPRGTSTPKGARWPAAENARLRAHAAGTISYTELCAQLPGRTWDAIETQRRVLCLTRQPQAVYAVLPRAEEQPKTYAGGFTQVLPKVLMS